MNTVLPGSPATYSSWEKTANIYRDKDSFLMKSAKVMGVFLGFISIIGTIPTVIYLINKLKGKTQSVLDSYAHYRETNGSEIITNGKVRMVSIENRIVAPSSSQEFKFQYSRDRLSRVEKLEEQDLFALEVLKNPDNIKAVQKCSEKLADYLEKYASSSEDAFSIMEIDKSIAGIKGKYPTLRAKFLYTESLLKFFREEKDPILLLSVIWTVFVSGNQDSSDDDINHIYKKYIVPQKDYLESKEKPSPDLRFGNSGVISNAPLFTSKGIVPYIKDIDYRSINPDAKHPDLKEYLSGQKAFVAGPSGMANMFCKVLNHLEIHPHSVEGKKLCETFSAFVVGSGMHSYEEVYDSFNLYSPIRPIHLVKKVLSDWKFNLLKNNG